MSVDADGAKALLHRAAALRMPTFTRNDPVSERVERLEDYMAQAAVTRGDLEEARLMMDHARHNLEGDWDRIEGWAQHAPNKPTVKQIVEAKRLLKPDLYESIRQAKWLVARLGDQVRRLEKDEVTASRRYSLITGS